jgi:DNA-binding MarR family transcriptional regulator
MSTTSGISEATATDFNQASNQATNPAASQVSNQVSNSVPFSTTLLVRDKCLCLHVQRAARLLARRFDAALKPVGLTNGQFSLLMSLNRPDMPGVPKATVGSVSELLGMDRTTLTAACRVLYGRGLMTLVSERTDKRSKVLKLTAEGQRVLALAVPIWTREHELIEAQLGDGGADRLRHDLRVASK